VTIRVAVVDENEIFRRGVVACLGENGRFHVASAWPEPLVGADAAAVAADVDVAVVSARAAVESELTCALVVCASARFVPADDDERVLAHLPRSGLTAEQLAAAVVGAAAGLKVSRRDEARPQLDVRRLRILRLLADGASTEEISRALRYSPRTIKGLVASIEAELESRTRAQAVATAIRAELI
jgi:DNA-binding NarL/FixJ family response regulator